MSYNVLAQCYVKSSFFPYCKPAVLRWKNRSTKLAEIIAGLPLRPHVICLQEVDNFSEFWSSAMQKLGYQGLYVQKQGRKRDGVAIFWQENAVELVRHQTVGLDFPIGDESGCSGDLLERSERGSVGLIAEFKSMSLCKSRQTVEFVVATTHLFWDPTQEDVKLLQTQRMLRRIDEYMGDRELPLMFAGDFNSLPKSAVYDYIVRNKFRSSYSAYDPGNDSNGEPSFTNVNGLATDSDKNEVPNFIGTLDYIFFRSSRLHPVALLEIMSKEEATKERALPSTFSPSDHLPLICEFDVVM